MFTTKNNKIVSEETIEKISYEVGYTLMLYIRGLRI